MKKMPLDFKIDSLSAEACRMDKEYNYYEESLPTLKLRQAKAERGIAFGDP